MGRSVGSRWRCCEAECQSACMDWGCPAGPGARHKSVEAILAEAPRWRMRNRPWPRPCGSTCNCRRRQAATRERRRSRKPKKRGRCPRTEVKAPSVEASTSAMSGNQSAKARQGQDAQRASRPSFFIHGKLTIVRETCLRCLLGRAWLSCWAP